MTSSRMQLGSFPVCIAKVIAIRMYVGAHPTDLLDGQEGDGPVCAWGASLENLHSSYRAARHMLAHYARLPRFVPVETCARNI